ncbi:restriction endonuclease subunit S [Nodularia spumigena CS-584]|uniref:restriction endonuclease subunit S n=1 Tax=Nodularia spumigena TaxID=70799 RepID=UPI0000EACBE1|nr:restriction endonuclease subunit S [Nodularia spumigena]AHJ27610.1 Type I restriction-modification system, specificity subunit S [Nodularia spumigena CCY9414]EAW42873.1 hypothetical protein N9414_06519 [Nodularia spumigena CCY9414]MDB9383001.1 restriction endonuclease subunit S [Nodularia spumigena CS-584]
MKRYPHYKDSGIDWLGDIPEHWEIVRFSNFINFQEGPGIMAADFKDYGVPLLRIHNLKPGFVDLERCNYLEPQKVEKTWKHFKLNEDDILISCSASTGLVSIVDKKAEGSIAYTGIIRLKPANSNICREFIKIIVASELFFTQIELLKTGTTIQHYGPTHLRQIKITFPPLYEQKKIACFLDSKLEEIDKFISNKQRLIELLKEQKTAIINRAVTKGLNPHAPMKPSGIEWLGDIPAHWEVTRAKHISYVFVPQRNKPNLNLNIGFPWITMEDITSPSISKSTFGYLVSEIDAMNAGSKLLPEGSVIASCVGNFGLSSVNTLQVIINQQLQAYIPIKINPYYLRYLIGISKSYFEQIANATTLAYVNQAGFAELPIILPPNDEQLAIVRNIDKELTTIDKAITTIEKEIELIKEYRTTLISEAVTGKIDVRETAAHE